MINILCVLSICLYCSNTLGMNPMTEQQQLDTLAKSQKWEVKDEDIQAANEALAQIKKYNNSQQWDDNLCKLHIVACCGLESREFRTYFETSMERFCDNYKLHMLKTAFEQMCNEQNIDFKILYENLVFQMNAVFLARIYYFLAEDIVQRASDEFTNMQAAVAYVKKSIFLAFICLYPDARHAGVLSDALHLFENILERNKHDIY